MIKKFFKRFSEIAAKCLFVYAFAGGVYLLIETFFRGYTFLEMYYLAGLLGLIMLAVNEYVFTYDTDYLIQVSSLTLVGTLAEGICGYLYNYDFHIWDYRGLPGTFFGGQCNILFVIAWLIIFSVMIPVLDYIDWRVFKYMENTPPYYKIFGHKIFQFKK